MLRRLVTPTTIDEIVAAADGGLKALLAPPFMHGAGHWMSFRTWNLGGTVFIQSIPERLDPADVWGLVEREQLNFLLIVGDAFARPLLDELERIDRTTCQSLTVLLSGGAPLSAPIEGGVPRPPAVADHRRRPRLVGGRRPVGARVGRQQGHDRNVRDQPRQPRARRPTSTASCRPATKSSAGWPRAAGWRSATSATQPRPRARIPSIDGVRYAVPGDRARLRADGVVELHGRDSVDHQLRRREDLRRGGRGGDQGASATCTTAWWPAGRASAGATRSSPSCGSVPAYEPDEASLLAEAERHIARYKLPKAFVFVDEVVRSPSGKADYRWAKQIAASVAA